MANNIQQNTPLKDLKALEEFAAQFVLKVQPNDILMLKGPMGAGKTTFVRALAQQISARAGGAPSHSSVASPTYALHHRYPGPTAHAEHAHPIDEVEYRIEYIDHWDLFRIKDLSELDVAGFWELMEEPGGLVVIEWPELIPETYWPQGRRRWALEFSQDSSLRQVSVGLLQ